MKSDRFSNAFNTWKLFSLSNENSVEFLLFSVERNRFWNEFAWTAECVAERWQTHLWWIGILVATKLFPLLLRMNGWWINPEEPIFVHENSWSQGLSTATDSVYRAARWLSVSIEVTMQNIPNPSPTNMEWRECLRGVRCRVFYVKGVIVGANKHFHVVNWLASRRKRTS